MATAITGLYGRVGLGLLETQDDRMMRKAGAYLSLELHSSGPSELAECLLYLIGKVDTQNTEIRRMEAKIKSMEVARK